MGLPQVYVDYRSRTLEFFNVMFDIDDRVFARLVCVFMHIECSDGTVIFHHVGDLPKSIH